MYVKEEMTEEKMEPALVEKPSPVKKEVKEEEEEEESQMGRVLFSIDDPVPIKDDLDDEYEERVSEACATCATIGPIYTRTTIKREVGAPFNSSFTQLDRLTSEKTAAPSETGAVCGLDDFPINLKREWREEKMDEEGVSGADATIASAYSPDTIKGEVKEECEDGVSEACAFVGSIYTRATIKAEVKEEEEGEERSRAIYSPFTPVERVKTEDVEAPSESGATIDSAHSVIYLSEDGEDCEARMVDLSDVKKEVMSEVMEGMEDDDLDEMNPLDPFPFPAAAKREDEEDGEEWEDGSDAGAVIYPHAVPVESARVFAMGNEKPKNPANNGLVRKTIAKVARSDAHRARKMRTNKRSNDRIGTVRKDMFKTIKSMTSPEEWRANLPLVRPMISSLLTTKIKKRRAPLFAILQIVERAPSREECLPFLQEEIVGLLALLMQDYQPVAKCAAYIITVYSRCLQNEYVTRLVEKHIVVLDGRAEHFECDVLELDVIIGGIIRFLLVSFPSQRVEHLRQARHLLNMASPGLKSAGAALFSLLLVDGVPDEHLDGEIEKDLLSCQQQVSADAVKSRTIASAIVDVRGRLSRKEK